MILLTSTSDLLRVITSAAVTVDVHASFVDMNGSTITPGRTNTAITTATTTTVVASPGASTYRTVKSVQIRNTHASSAVDITVVHTDGTTAVNVIKVTLAAGVALHYDEGNGFKLIEVTGEIVVTDANFSVTGSADETKIAKFEVDGFTTATTRTFTLPDATTTLVGTGTTQTLSGKTFSDNPTFSGGVANAVPYLNGSKVLTSSASEITYDGTTLSLLKGQLKFPATQNPSADANTLDDYEEGTWTPTISSTVGTITSYTINSANYVKIGQLVACMMVFTIDDNGTGSGYINVSYPFTAGINSSGFGINNNTARTIWSGITTGTSTGVCGRYDNTYPAATGNQLRLTVVYTI